ncbi:MAG: NAD(P)-dependent oxidoreductase [Chloroflexota bacterium]
MDRKSNARRLKIFASGAISSDWLARFAEDFEVDYLDWANQARGLSPEAFIERLQGCHVLITELDEIDANILNATPDLAAIIDCRAAVVNIDVDAATQRDIAVFNTPGRNADAVADLTVAMMVMALRKVGLAVQHIRSNDWFERGHQQSYLLHRGHELPGKIIGLVGVGIIGRKVAARLRGFEVKLLGYDPFVSAGAMAGWSIEKVELDDLLRRADIVSLHAPATGATTGMIGARQFGLMKPTAYLINTARAALVDEASLMDVLTRQKIAGAALDVYHQEPIPADHPLLQLPHVTALPHIGGATLEVADHHSRLAYENLTNFLKGNYINIINPAAIEAARTRLRRVINPDM